MRLLAGQMIEAEAVVVQNYFVTGPEVEVAAVEEDEIDVVFGTETEIEIEAYVEAEAGTTSSRWPVLRQGRQQESQVAVSRDEERAAQASRWPAMRVVAD